MLRLQASLGRPDVLFEPLHQRQVVREAPEEGHRRVGMSVDEARDKRLPRAVDHVVFGLRFHAWADLGDDAVVAAHAHDLPFEGGIRYRKSHPVRLGEYRALRRGAAQAL